MPGFPFTPLGDVVRLDIQRVPVCASETYNVAGVLIAGGGLFWRDAVKGDETTYPFLHRLRADQLVYRKLTAWEGPITVVPAEFDGAHVSPEFPTYTLDTERLAPNFMRLVCTQPLFHEEMRALSTGTAERRSRLNPSELLEIEVPLPPLEQQWEIVRMLEPIDALHRSQEAELAGLDDVIVAVREDLINTAPAEEVAVGDVVGAIDSGRSPKCLDRPPNDGEWGVLKTSSIRPGEFRDEAKALPGDVSPVTSASIRAGDVLTVRASGSRRLVGAVCRVETPIPNRMMSDYHMRLALNDDVDPDYFVEVMATTRVREQVELAATGSTTALKLSRDRLRSVQIPLAPMSVQTAIARKMSRLKELRRALEAEGAALTLARTSLVHELLTGQQDPVTVHPRAAA